MQSIQDTPALSNTTLVVATPADDQQAAASQSAQRVLRMIPVVSQSGVETVAGAAHLVHEERPAEVAQRLLAALPGASDSRTNAQG